MKKNNKGFTLAELLIVVAIIAVLIAIIVPVFTTQLEKAREATDADNIRGAYGQVSADALTSTDPDALLVKLQQQVTDWSDNTTFGETFAKLGKIDTDTNSGIPQKDGYCLVEWNEDLQKIEFTFLTSAEGAIADTASGVASGCKRYN